MGAVVEATLRRELGDIGECAVDVALPDLELTEPRRVDDDRAAGQDEQLAVPRRVPAAAVATQVTHVHDCTSGQPVHERRLPRSRGAEQDERLRGPEQRPNLLDALASDVAQCVDGNPDRDALRLEQLAGVVAHVELGEHDNWIAARVPGSGEVSLQPARIEVLVEPGDEHDRVHVRDEDVLLRLQPRRLARDLRAARQERLDREPIADSIADDDPVADGRHAAPDLVVAHASTRLREPVADLRTDVVAAAVLRDDASGSKPALCIGCEGRLELVGPTEVGQDSIGQR